MKACALLLSLLMALAGCPARAEGEDDPAPDRRREIDARIEALDARRTAISTEGPKTATFLGLGMAVAGGVVFGAGASSCPSFEVEPSCGLGTLIAGGSLLLIGGIAALSGGVIWGQRVKRRNAIDTERELLIEERDGLAAALSRLQLSSEVRDGAHFVTLGARF